MTSRSSRLKRFSFELIGSHWGIKTDDILRKRVAAAAAPRDFESLLLSDPWVDPRHPLSHSKPLRCKFARPANNIGDEMNYVSILNKEKQ